jgi:hypothetical protein
MTDEKTHEHCWHVPTNALMRTCYPPQIEIVCCHCGIRSWKTELRPTALPGHGQFYPK